jgi:hypothetical protein
MNPLSTTRLPASVTIATVGAVTRYVTSFTPSRGILPSPPTTLRPPTIVERWFFIAQDRETRHRTWGVLHDEFDRRSFVRRSTGRSESHRTVRICLPSFSKTASDNRATPARAIAPSTSSKASRLISPLGNSSACSFPVDFCSPERRAANTRKSVACSSSVAVRKRCAAQPAGFLRAPRPDLGTRRTGDRAGSSVKHRRGRPESSQHLHAL